MAVLEYNTVNGKRLVDVGDSAVAALITAAASLKKLTTCSCNDAKRAELKSKIQEIIDSGSSRAAMHYESDEWAATKVAQLSVGVWNECTRQA